MTLALVLDSSGFSRRSRIFPGNVSEPATLGQMIEQLRSPLDPDKEEPGKDGAGDSHPSLDLRPVPTIIMDAGIASEDNIQWLQDHGYKYIVVSRKHHMEFDEERCVAVKERENDTRSGWVSGLDEQEGERHPTIGGLRIGKAMDERGPEDPCDEVLEWDRDGQYFHYLNKWMHALNRVSRVTGDPVYNRWAAELARTAHARFTYVPSFGGQKRMYWKMSIDLSQPLVPSMGQHDSLDGYITYSQLQSCLPEGQAEMTGPDLEGEITEMAAICRGQSWATGDALGIGGLLCDTWKLAQMMIECDFSQSELLENLLNVSLTGLQSFIRTDALRLPATYRLPFREFGFSIGLRAIQRFQGSMQKQPELHKNHAYLHGPVGVLMGYQPLVKEIEAFWLDPVNQEAKTWKEHFDINSVMLATILAPGGFLTV